MEFYKDDAVIFGKVLCTHCGSDTDLMYVELNAYDGKEFHTHNTELCRECYRALPTREEEEEANA